MRQSHAARGRRQAADRAKRGSFTPVVFHPHYTRETTILVHVDHDDRGDALGILRPLMGAPMQRA